MRYSKIFAWLALLEFVDAAIIICSMMKGVEMNFILNALLCFKIYRVVILVQLILKFQIMRWRCSLERHFLSYMI